MSSCVQHNNNSAYFRNGQRLRRGGRRKTHTIQIVCGRRPTPTERPSRPPSTLKSIETLDSSILNNSSSSNLTNINNYLKIGYINAQSVRNKIEDIYDLIIENKLDIFLLTETWLYPSGDESILQSLTPPIYLIKSFPRSDRRGGGIAIIHRHELSNKLFVKATSHFCHSSFETTEFVVDLGSKFFNFICIYRPPYSSNNTIFIEEFQNLIAYLNSIKGIPIIIGDFNFHFDSPTSSEVMRLKDIIETNNMAQIVTEPTHQKNHIIDWVVLPQSITENGTLMKITNSQKLVSDHNFISIQLNSSRPSPLKRTILTRNIKNINIENMKNEVKVRLKEEIDIDQLNNVLRTTLEKHAPVVQKTITSRPYAPWYNIEVRSAKREFRKAERMWRKSGQQSHKDDALSRRKKWKTLMKKAKKEHYFERFKTSKSIKQSFNICDELLGKTKDKTLPNFYPYQNLPTMFASFFNDKICKLRENLDKCEIADSFHQHEGDHFETFSPVSQDFVKDIILKSTPTTCDLDPIPSSLFNSCIDEMLPAITYVINASLSTGIVPKSLKQALIKPLLKKKSLDHNILKNYRPVSNLPFLSKILEKVVLSQLLQHLNSQRLLEPLQSAYRANHCTETALLKVMNDLLVEADSGKAVLLGLLDLSAAFDTIDHNILLKRLELSFGIKGICLQWFESYLSDRTQSVVINGIKSDNHTLEFGVPQGSVLGPILFTLYIQPLAKEIKNFDFKYHSYADDTQIYNSALPRNFDSLVSSFQNCISSIKDWMSLNRLVLNGDKTEILILGTPNSRKKIGISKIDIFDTEIQLSSTARNLGVFFDTDFSMSTTVNQLLKKINFEIHNISHVKHLLPKDILATIVNSLILSKLDYCNSLLFGISREKLAKLQTAQNNAARLILKKGKFEHATPLLKTLHWLPVEKRINYKLLTLCHRCVHGEVPSYLSNMICPYISSRQLRSSNDKTRLVVPNRRLKTIGDRSFSYCAPKIWNTLPQNLREINNYETFKKKLKTFLF